ncbi:flagellar motor switch phosphatase FliY [Candidatus Formimonas warabiya]|uniref:Flagellar motor switch protein FliN n=1 Tax=Formimonas warabiya TaxID=1761012 RepID=A0A3G1KTC0_FORW1|nr:flagellar motor switch phosphatase FliY [Candidatus Formimonas warabiya]ATW25644.1 flagellar motor switch protein FliN [Candidatus Formimonas warabiya]
MSKFLNQSEIDALLKKDYEQEELLSPEELDALGEVANISMGSGATALSELVNHKVEITNPQVLQVDLEEFLDHLPKPHLAISVEFISGLLGSNLLVISNQDAGILAKMMMGESPTSDTEYLDEIQISAASEAMNQMVASAATAMSQVFQRTVNISPPDIKPFTHQVLDELIRKTKLVAIKFNMKIGDFLNSELFQILPIETAKEQARLLFETTEVPPPVSAPDNQMITPSVSNQPVISEPVSNPPFNRPIEEAPYDIRMNAGAASEVFSGDTNIDLILDIPLTVSVILGRTKKPIQEILMYQSGSIVELNRLVEENVDIMINDVLVAKGEVVVINDNFGVRITNIINPKERITQLRNGSLI